MQKHTHTAAAASFYCCKPSAASCCCKLQAAATASCCCCCFCCKVQTAADAAASCCCRCKLKLLLLYKGCKATNVTKAAMLQGLQGQKRMQPFPGCAAIPRLCNHSLAVWQFQGFVTASRLPNQFPGCVAACSGAFLLTLPSINGLKQKAVLFADASLVCLCKHALHMIMALQIPAQPITLASMLPLSAGEPTHSLSKLAQLNSSSLPNLRARTYVLNKTFSFANTSPFPKWGRPCTIEFQGAQMGSREP
jgi:hypothetical protein